MARLQHIRQSIWTPGEQLVECTRTWGSLDWADNTVSLRRHAQLLLQRLCNEANLLTPLQEHFLQVFTQNLQPRPQRFPALQACITDKLAPALAAALIAELEPKLQRIVESTLAELYFPERPLSAQTKHRVKHMDKILAGCIISHFREAIDNEFEVPATMQLPEGFKLEEALEVQGQRAQLHAAIGRLQTANSQISHIEDAFSTPDSPSAALAAAVDSAFGPAPDETVPQHLATNAQSAVDQQTLQGTTSLSAAAPTAMTARPPATVRSTGATDVSTAAGTHAQAANQPVQHTFGPTAVGVAETEAELESICASPVASVADSLD